MGDFDVGEIADRAERARGALLSVLATCTEKDFARDPEGGWSVSRIVRHIVWVEHFWTLVAERARDTAEGVVDLGQEASRPIAIEASRLSGTPEEPLAAPPPYVTRSEGVGGLEESRRHFAVAIASLNVEHLRKRITTRRGILSLRFAVEHVIEHDWEHAVQIAATRR